MLGPWVRHLQRCSVSLHRRVCNRFSQRVQFGRLPVSCDAQANIRMVDLEACKEMILCHVHVSLRGCERRMPEDLLSDSEVRTIPEQ